MYKYTEKFVADLLFKKNAIRIGTLEGFQKMEHKAGISDPLEGYYVDELKLDHFNQDDYHSIPSLKESLKGNMSIGQNSTVNVYGGTFRKEIRSPNYLIFCFAHTKSKSIMQEFEGADTCFQIVRPLFFPLITWSLEKKLQTKVKFLGVHEIIYGNKLRTRTDKYSERIPPALAKTQQFASQCELRAIWEVPENFTLNQPHYDLTNVVGLRTCCEIIEL